MVGAVSGRMDRDGAKGRALVRPVELKNCRHKRQHDPGPGALPTDESLP